MPSDYGEHTPGPWCWSFIGEKTNGYIIGKAYDENDNELSGFVDIDVPIHDPIMVGEHEAAVCNYADAELMASAPTLAADLEAEKQKVARLTAALKGLFESFEIDTGKQGKPYWIPTNADAVLNARALLASLTTPNQAKEN